MSTTALKATFKGTGLRPAFPPNPDFPEGIDVSFGSGGPTCTAALAYPAESVGHWLVKCTVCGYRLVVTAASRADDPRSVTLPCQLAGNA